MIDNNLWNPKWILGLSIFGYSLFASISLILGVASQPINILFRFIVLAISIILILIEFIKKKFLIKVDAIFCFYVFFWGYYVSKLVFQLFILKIDFSPALGSEFVILLFIFGSSLIPSLSIYFTDFSKLVVSEILVFLLKFGLISNLLIFYVQFKLFGFSKEMFLSRALFLNTDDGNVLNPITISMNGTYLIIISVSLIFLVNVKSSKIKVLAIISLILGGVNLIIGASRGPFLALIIQFVFILYVKRAIFVKNFLKSFSLLLGVSIVFFLWAKDLFMNADFALMNRIFNTLDSGASNDDRYILLNLAFNDFLLNPIFGNNFVLEFNGFYPHNLLLEVLMATGLIGSFFFLPILLKALFKCFFHINKNKLLVPFYCIFLSIFILTNTSGAIYYSDDFWIWLIFINKIG